MRLSATRLRTYQTCPRQYRYRYVDELPTVVSGPLVFGKTLHAAICDVHRHSLGRHVQPDVHGRRCPEEHHRHVPGRLELQRQRGERRRQSHGRPGRDDHHDHEQRRARHRDRARTGVPGQLQRRSDRARGGDADG